MFQLIYKCNIIILVNVVEMHYFRTELSAYFNFINPDIIK